MPTATMSDTTLSPLVKESEAIFRQHSQLIYRTAFAITGQSQDAEDVLQTIFLKLLRREFPPDLSRNPRAYLYRAAVNASLSIIRSRRWQVQIVDMDRLKATVHVDGNTGEEIQKRLLDAIGRLNAKAVEILMLRYVHNYSDAEIAKMLGTSRGTIAVSLNRSRSRIRKLMQAASGEES
jgi:RNA polymerase sigma-70 factor (ECF subfamily)